MHVQNITNKTTINFDDMINDMEKINLDQLKRDIKFNHRELVKKLKLVGLAEFKVINMY